MTVPTTIADVMGWTSRPVDLSIREMRHPQGSLSRWPREQEPPAWQRDEPTDAEEARA